MHGVAVSALTLAVVAAVLVAVWAVRRHRQAEAKIERLQRELSAERYAARHDTLTHLLNRRGFYHYGLAAVGDPGRSRIAVILLDLDNFKQINDRLGHAAGDEVLGVVARRFADSAGGQLAARLGGDEFACLITPPTADAGWLDVVTAQIAGAISVPIAVGDVVVSVSASVGAAPVYGSELSHFADALRSADRDMYRAKAAGRGVPSAAGLGSVGPSGLVTHHVARTLRPAQGDGAHRAPGVGRAYRR
jgi:diguanylate cyclase (GGDEF)-like protein